MSSHHIVKEKQEPALYIHELADFDEEYLGQLLEWSPTLLVKDSEYEKVLSLGIKVDVLVGDNFDRNEAQENLKIIPSTGKGLFDALNYLQVEKYPAVNIISKIRYFDDYTCFLTQINMVLFTKEIKYFAIKDGFSFWKIKGTKILVDIVSYFEADNLMQIDENTFEVAEDGMVSFRFAAPYLFLGEMLD